MEVKTIRILPFFTAIFSILLFGGCSPAYRGNLYKLDVPETCPSSVEDALAPMNVDPLTAALPQLSCALQTIRNMKSPGTRPDGHDSLLASKICVVLAESSCAGEEGARRTRELGWEGVGWAEHAMRTGLLYNAATSYYYSINLGVAVRDTIMAAMRYMNKLHHHLKRAARETPEIDHAGPLRTLGYFMIRAPAWPIGPGDSEKGLKLLLKAARLYPEYPPNQIYLARGFWEGEEDDEAAMEGVKAAIKLLKRKNWGLRHHAWVLDLKSLLVDMLDEGEVAKMIAGLETATPLPKVNP